MENLDLRSRDKTDDCGKTVQPSTYSGVSTLIDLNDPNNLKLWDIGISPVTKILYLELT